MPLPAPKEIIRELPPVRHHLPETVSIELADEAREVVMLEIVGQEISGELGRTPNDERGVVLAP
jgi:hypothetical protein